MSQLCAKCKRFSIHLSMGLVHVYVEESVDDDICSEVIYPSNLHGFPGMVVGGSIWSKENRKNGIKNECYW